MEIKTWEDAEIAAQEYAEATSKLERLTEGLKAFAERRHDQVGKARNLGPVIIGFRKEAEAAVISNQSSAISFLKTKGYASFIKLVQEIDRTKLRNYLSRNGAEELEKLRLAGITLRAATEKFYLKLARNSGKE